MTKLFEKISLLFLTFLQFGCSGFLNPSNDCFLDWNMNCIEKEKQTLSKAGYVYTYPGNSEEAKIIFNRCMLENKNNASTKEECLLRNGFKKL
ncbi:TPA: hypothetical protein RVS72_000583 [Pasteurella multocida]|uniref:hypothetical protein n=1 Tax=Pasteurella multocida TaxID=747 RepID=UPI00201FF990|nr:hypothetical protein [Pasteurella multocida]MCL7815978.1 hypothetical protein [Pasteurella multocida]MDY0640454.1 hypothetical protein [Pasteurella multocida]URH82778.1 hypothetical protein M8847_02315 [Pasteurella multocida]HDR1027182.1 hypothetical protein [Pasteurella multocida]HDR1103840.1 hypothetical protein [Pasteurella multocida]